MTDRFFNFINGGRRILGTLLGALVLLLPVLAWGVSAALADFAIADWPYRKPISLPGEVVPDGLSELVVDSEVLVHGAPGLADLRIIEASGGEIPYQLTVERGRRSRASVPGLVQDLGHVPGERTSFVVDLGRSGVFHNEVEIRTTSRNFQRAVTVEASSDRESWAVLVEGIRIFNLTLPERDFSTSETAVAYPESTARFLRVTIRNGNEDPLEITGAQVSSLSEAEVRLTDYPASLSQQPVEAADRGVSVYLLDLGAAGLPTSRLTLRTEDTNFYRETRLEGSNDAETWMPVPGSGVLYSYDTPRFTGSSLALEYSETTYRYLRLTIRNEDNPPVAVDQVQVSGLVRRILFPPRPGESYHLYYGNRAARAPSYDLERFLPYLETEDLPVAALGAEAENPDFRAPQAPVSERYSWLITLGVVVAAVAVGLLLLGVLRRARTLLPPPGEGSQ